jgi:hypothetical protein
VNLFKLPLNQKKGRHNARLRPPAQGQNVLIGVTITGITRGGPVPERSVVQVGITKQKHCGKIEPILCCSADCLLAARGEEGGEICRMVSAQVWRCIYFRPA